MQNYKIWTPEEDNLLKTLVLQNKYSYNQMAKFFMSRSGTSLRKRAVNYLNLDNKKFVFKKYSYNENFFEIPNLINCYVAGYYAADGCISHNSTTKVLSLTASILDEPQLKIFRDLFKYNGILFEYKSEYDTEMRILNLYSAYKITEDLRKNFNLGPNKMYILPPPNLTDPDFKLAYMAGLLDGDGCVHINTNNILVINYTSASINIIEWFKNEVESMNLSFLKNRKGQVRLKKDTKAYQYQVCGYKAICLVEKILELKSKGVPILDRKWNNEKLDNYIKIFKAKFLNKIKNPE